MTAVVQRDGERDEVAVEEPLEIRVDGAALTITMRTPGHDEELALGFLYGEGLIDVAARRRARPTTSRPTSSTCAGRCCATRARGASTRRRRAGCAARARSRRSPCTRRSLPDGPRVARALLAALPDGLRQPAFGRTGGMHATGLFDAAGEALLVREDVGRHNAMDKVVGRALLDGLLPLHGHVLCVSGPAVVRARAEGGGGGRADPRRRRRADVAGGRARRRPRHDARRLRARRQRQRLQRGSARDVTEKNGCAPTGRGCRHCHEHLSRHIRAVPA